MHICYRAYGRDDNLANDPYASGKFHKNPYAKKTDVTGSLVVVLDGIMEDRGLSLIKPISRCVCKHEVHELILTDETGAKPGGEVNRIAYLGFCTIGEGGVIVSGDDFYVDGKLIGQLAGFDETHMPNHLNIVIKTDKLRTGIELEAALGNKIVFKGM
ncbi:hypothetical protein SCACP_36250 [Sporomusa carbonis]